jgi:hypothetical protein
MILQVAATIASLFITLAYVRAIVMLSPYAHLIN